MNISHMNKLVHTTVVENPDGTGHLVYDTRTLITWTPTTLIVRVPHTALERRRLILALAHLRTPWTLGYNRAQKRATLTRLARIHRKACVVKVPLTHCTILVSRNPHGLEL